MSFSSGDRRGAMSDINVTPLVDVMLVLLIIFMVTAPMMTQGVDVNLPKASAKGLNSEEEKIILTITRDRQIYINKAEVSKSELSEKIKHIFANKPNREVFLKADRDVTYGFVVEVMATLKRAGIEKVGMVTEPTLDKK